MYPKESVQEVLYEAKAGVRIFPGKEIVPGLISLPRIVKGSKDNGGLSNGMIATIARELMADRHSPTAAAVVAEQPDLVGCVEPVDKDAWLPLLEYLCRVVNVTLKKDTFSRQGPHAQFVTVLTAAEPIEGIPKRKFYSYIDNFSSKKLGEYQFYNQMCVFQFEIFNCFLFLQKF